MNEAAHTPARELIGVYACDAVDGDERALVEAHLSECAECSDEAARLREALAALVAAAAVPAPEAVRALVLDKVRATHRPTGQAPAPSSERRRRTRTADRHGHLPDGDRALHVLADAADVGVVARLVRSVEGDRGAGCASQGSATGLRRP